MTAKTSKNNDSTFTCRADKDLVEAFKRIAKDNNRTASQLVRDYMIAYVNVKDKPFDNLGVIGLYVGVFYGV
jgi:predicted transcriptional regulator